MSTWRASLASLLQLSVQFITVFLFAYCLFSLHLFSCYRAEKWFFLSCVPTMSKELLGTQVSRGMKSHSTIHSNPSLASERGRVRAASAHWPRREVRGARDLIRKPGTEQEGPLMSTGGRQGGRGQAPFSGGWDARQEA